MQVLETRVLLSAAMVEGQMAESMVTTAVVTESAMIGIISKAGDDSDSLFSETVASYSEDNTGAAPFQNVSRWTTTATNGSGLTQGTPTTLTWSFLDDGTNIPGAAFVGDATAPSNLIAFLDTNRGAGAGGSDLTQRPWFSLFSDSFARMGAVSGLTYVYEPNDDAAAFISSAGALGLRGDLRIGGHFIDGEAGPHTLAYNYFPGSGDMVIDTGDPVFYSDTASNSVGFRNTIMHENGHGVGIDHVESSNANFLMEPFINTAFDGPQLDDILALQRHYGDSLEKAGGNDTSATATALGTLSAGATVSRGALGNSTVVGASDTDFVSIDDESDFDFFSFTVSANVAVSLTLTPRGVTYQQGPQDGTQTAFNVAAQNDLTLQLRDTNGTTILQAANATGLGGSETLSFTLTNSGTYFVRVSGATTNTIQLYGLSVTATNTAPTTVAMSPTSVAENQPSGTAVGNFSTTDPDVGNTHTYTLVSGTGSTDNASFTIVGNELRTAASFDFETKSSYAIRVRSTDQGNLGTEQTFTISVTDVNEPPTAVVLQNVTSSLAENVSTATAIKLADIAVTDDALGTNVLSLSGTDAASFEIVGNELRLKAGVVLDFETQTSYAITVSVDDTAVGVAPDASVLFTLTITDVSEGGNTPPTLTLQNTVTTLAENTSTVTAIRVADIVITDDGQGTNVLSLSGADAASFEIVGNELRLKAGTVLDFETKNSYAVTVNVDDTAVGGTPDASVAFTLNISNVNEAPTAVALQNVTGSLAENANTASATKLADIVVTDDALGSESLTLSGTDAASFEIVGSELRLKSGVVLDFESKTSYAVTVSVDDSTVGGTPDASVNFTLTITDVAEGTPVTFLDDGDAGFALTGSWNNVAGYGFGLDAKAATGNTGTKKATWTFTGLTAGQQYRVETTWLSGSDRADNAPYVIRDGVGGAVIGGAVVNQKNNPPAANAPGGAPAQGGRPFGILGTVTITGTTLVVELSNTGTNGAIIADAMRLFLIPPPPPDTPEIEVLDGVASLNDGSNFDFGQVLLGATVTKTFTVKNDVTATGNLLLQPITVTGSAFTRTSPNFTVNQPLAPGEMTTITIAFDTTNLGTFSGGLSFGNNDPDEGPFDLTFTGKVNAEAPLTVTLDDGDSGFSLTGSWNNVPGYGFGLDAKAATGTDGSKKATWNFSGLAVGEYRIAATWLPGSDRANNAPYVIRDGVGGAVLSNVAINQRNAPSGATSEGGRPFANLGTVIITGNSLVIELSNTATNGAIIADAIRIERIPAPVGPRLDVKDGANTLLDNGTLNVGSANQNGPALTKTITVKNTGVSNLILQPITVTGTGYSLASPNFTPGQTLAPNTSVDITVRLATTTAGTFNGTLSFGHNDGGPFDLALTGTINVIQPPGVHLIDDGDTGFSLAGSWSNVAGYGYGLDAKAATGSDGTKKATWIFTGLDAGQYRIAATWLPGSDRANNAAYAFKEGTTTIGTASVNQRNTPAGGPTVGGRPFSNIGLVTISGNTLTIELANLAGTNGAIIADAIRIEKVA